MRVFCGLIAVFTIAAFSGSISEAQTVKKGTLTGKILTRSVNVPDLGSAAVFTTDVEAKGAFWLILTQVCVEDEGDLTFDGNTMGQIVLDNECTTFEPGLAIPRGETLTFTETGNQGAQGAMITGILVKK